MLGAIGVLSLFLQVTLASNNLKQDVDNAVKVFLKDSGATAASIAIYSQDDWQFEKYYGVATKRSKYDLASLTKPLITTYAVLWLIENHLAEKNELIVNTLPEFAKCKWVQEVFPVHSEKFKWKKPPEIDPLLCAKKSTMTVELMMRHRSGLRDVVPLDAITVAAVETGVDPITLFVESPLLAEPGATFHYADTNFIVLRKWVEEKLKPLGKSYQDILHEVLIPKLSLVDTGFFSDLKNHLSSTFIPTKSDVAPGIVHDPIARALGAKANGHAGLFSSLTDLKKIATFWMHVNSEPYLSATVSPEELPMGEKRGLGWDVDSSPFTESVRGPIDGGFGHSGYTGQSIWIEPKSKTIVIVLTNRTYLNENKKTAEATSELRKKIAALAWGLSSH